jgi:hypothetical protein
MAKGESPWGTLVSSAVLLLLAGVAFYLFFLPVLTRVHRARSWEVVPCEVLSSRIVTHAGRARGTTRHGTTYSIEIRYRYQRGGRSHTGSRYSFMDGGSDSSVKGKRAIVRQFKAGTTVDCYVDPSNPGNAVLNRGYPRMLWLILFPVLMAVVGLLGVVRSVRRMVRR